MSNEKCGLCKCADPMIMESTEATLDPATPLPKWDVDWDGRSQSVIPTATRHLILVRHGKYRKRAGKHHRHLTRRGRMQAHATGHRLAKLGVQYTRIMRSNMTRAVETSDIVAEHLCTTSSKVILEEPDKDLREGTPVRPEPAGHKKTTYSTDGARMESAFSKYFYRADAGQKKDSHEVLVIHGNIIRYFVCRALQFPPEAWKRISVYHGSLTWVTIRPDGTVKLKNLGDTGHISVNKPTN